MIFRLKQNRWLKSIGEKQDWQQCNFIFCIRCQCSWLAGWNFPREEKKKNTKKLGCTPEETRPWTSSLAGSEPTQHSRRHRAAPPSANPHPALLQSTTLLCFSLLLISRPETSNLLLLLLPASNCFFCRRSSRDFGLFPPSLIQCL